eukprot:scaffold250023_cov62-Attheya_sp.AAC.3
MQTYSQLEFVQHPSFVSTLVHCLLKDQGKLERDNCNAKMVKLAEDSKKQSLATASKLGDLIKRVEKLETSGKKKRRARKKEVEEADPELDAGSANSEGLDDTDDGVGGEEPALGRNGVFWGGEVAESSFMEGRHGRGDIQVVEFGDGNFAWADSAAQWGAKVAALVFRKIKTERKLKVLYPTVPRFLYRDVLLNTPGWLKDSLLLLTVAEESHVVSTIRLMDCITPMGVCIAVHPCISRRMVETLFKLSAGMTRFCSTVRHEDVGGVTTARWRLVQYGRERSVWSKVIEIDWVPYSRRMGDIVDPITDMDHSQPAWTPVETKELPDGTHMCGYRTKGDKETSFNDIGLLPDLGHDGVTYNPWVRVPSVLLSMRHVARRL